MWIFEGILYVILLLVFIRYDRKKRLWIKTVSQEEKFEHYLSELSAAYGKLLRRQWQKWKSHIRSRSPQNIPMCVSMAQCVRSSGRMEICFRMDILSFREICSI